MWDRRKTDGPRDKKKGGGEERSKKRHAPVSHCPNNNPTLSLHGKKFTSSTPRIFGRNQTAPTYARASLNLAATVTPTKMVTISTRPSTQPRSVVCSGEKPKEATMSWRWFVSEFGMLSTAANKEKRYVFGSVNASRNLYWMGMLRHS